MSEFDPVTKPEHYNQGNVECIEAIKAMLGLDGFVAYCRGNALKYNWRCLYKGKSREDLRKAKWYTEQANATLDEVADKQRDALDKLCRDGEYYKDLSKRRAYVPNLHEKPETD